jgi:signal transduction histidine kinase
MAVSSPREFRALLNQLLTFAARGVPWGEFLSELARRLLEFTGSDALELLLAGAAQRCHAAWDAGHTFRFAILPNGADATLVPAPLDRALLDEVRVAVAERRAAPTLPCFTQAGSFWLSDTAQAPAAPPPVHRVQGLRFEPPFRSFAAIRLGDSLLELWSVEAGWFTRERVESLEQHAESLGDALTHQRAQWALRERVKELTCLYGIARADEPGTPLAEALERIAALLPPGWQYPELCAARIELDELATSTPGFSDGVQRQSAEIVIDGRRRGCVEVVYAIEKPTLDEGPFLKEERSLINEVARQVSLIVERRQAEEEKVRLQEQLRHADRLATIGQLAAGAAHELNEPLGGVLGFAQLALKYPELPEPTRRDLGRIVTAAMHARDVIKKLILFGRQSQPRKSNVDLNAVVREGLEFIEARCRTEGIAVEKRLGQALPAVRADPGQLRQVLVNLAVNAVQAMPKGGRLAIETRAEGQDVVLEVADTGVGMSEEVQRQIFMPFFTTKDVGQGTGLGLSVVHGIVTAHGGSIEVESRPGRGSRFVVRLPLAGEAAPPRE